MLPDHPIKRIAAKELNLFFASPVAYIFLASFVSVTLFIFFWAEAYFARNIADLRPLFEWMPVILIFLSGALTMRMWSEEKRTGTLEHLLTLPVNPWDFVLGKFLACMVLLCLAIGLTLPLPITVSILADLDWGPVFSAYLATVLLGAAYLAVGLFVSSRSDNQIVSLILTTLVCGALYLLGSAVFTDLVSNSFANTLRALGTSSRFESITRGVIDWRDLYYYLSIAAVFLILNRYTLEKLRWASDGSKIRHRYWHLATVLLIFNVLTANLWLAPLSGLRIDTTEGNQYSISDATRSYLQQLQEPLLIRGYFSSKTHPLLAPLVPQLEDLLKEYRAENKNNIRVEIIDPTESTEVEEEAAGKYGIQPVPFRVADRHQSALVNSYFNVLVHYGDEYKVLGFRDLIDIKHEGDSDIDVRLRNPEYDISTAIKQTLQSYQTGGDLFDSIQKPVKLTAYISKDARLPESLKSFRKVLESSSASLQSEAQDKFLYKALDPDADGGEVAKQIAQQYGFRPMASSLFDRNTFYFYLVLSDGETAVQIPLPDTLSAEGLQRGLDSGLKRFASGLTKTIGMVTPPQGQFTMQQRAMPAAGSFQLLQQSLNQSTSSKVVDLNSGKVGDDLDLLMVIAPENLSEKELFAIDQFLMKGGTVIACTSPFQASFGQRLRAEKVNSGIDQWLQHHGIQIESQLVMDRQSTTFPVPVTRNVGGFNIREMMMIDYPYFVDVRDQGLNQDTAVTSGIPALTVTWASPIKVDEQKNKERTITELIKSSQGSWLSDDRNITPQVLPDGRSGFDLGKIAGPQLLAVATSGKFTSYFSGRDSPLLKIEEGEVESGEEQREESEVIGSVIEHSSESARLIVIASNSFAEDGILETLGSVDGAQHLEPVHMLNNCVEWSLEDHGLLSIRSRSHFNRTLPPMSTTEVQFWEYLNYGLALLLLVIIFIVRKWFDRTRYSRYHALLYGGAQV